ncbi:GNAT family N-acetyltransferase [Amorphus orientalis]|uniref:Ribosomal protein S18 acetylase RimI-like enzyme n=1 Tax=Amorphus orientalis TaxID=649198 RepID=A0AAE4AUB0_9HYPH|nr:GNAT family N-acetyltransferase [Amorphus orientalis]MDQ0317218.1 ribosomal protein S18 acetylase RimI-like enzyme [Amorphus orientalis]
MIAARPHSDFGIEVGLRAEHRKRAAKGYWEAFSRKLRYPLGPEAKAIAFLERVLDPSHAISAVSGAGTFLGVAGFKTPSGAFVGGGFGDLVATYGFAGAVVRGLLAGLLERECEPGTLLMDGIFVEPDARGRGVGKALLQAVERHAVASRLGHIRLDVIDTNPRARALYEREGFREKSVVSLGPLKAVFGFSRATEMTKAVSAGPNGPVV